MPNYNINQFQQKFRELSPGVSQQFQNRQFAQHLIQSTKKTVVTDDTAEQSQPADQSMIAHSKYLKPLAQAGNSMGSPLLSNAGPKKNARSFMDNSFNNRISAMSAEGEAN